MSIATLLLAIWIAWALSAAVDVLPGLDWVHLPNWVLWGIAIALISWCTDDGSSPMS